MDAEVIAIGDELTTGERLDTNSRWISKRLELLGLRVVRHTTVPDTLEDGVAAFREAAGRAGVIVATGGLGPTADDLTRDVLAAASGEPLEFVPEAFEAITALFTRRGRAMPERNRVQAMLPAGGRMIPNPEGTAPGIDLDLPGPAEFSARVFSLPGVPSEMHRMWAESVEPAIIGMLPGGGTIRFGVLKCFGAGESDIEAMLPDLVRRGRDPLVGITAHEATITLRIAARGADEATCLAKIAPVERTIRECLGKLVFGSGDDELEDAAVAACRQAGMTVATVEQATHGQVAMLLAGADARSGGRVFLGGSLVPCGVVLEPVAAAEACRATSGADLGLAVGPVEADEEGRSVTIALATPGKTFTIGHLLGGGGAVRLSRAAKTAIDCLRRGAP